MSDSLCPHSTPGSSVHSVLQTRILEWVVMPSPRGSSQPTDLTHVSCVGRRILYYKATMEAHIKSYYISYIFTSQIKIVFWLPWSSRFFVTMHPLIGSNKNKTICISSLHCMCLPFCLSLSHNHTAKCNWEFKIILTSNSTTGYKSKTPLCM